MTSKTLFFKLMREDLKNRIWAPALLALGFFFLFPVYTAFCAGDMKNYTDAALALKNYTSQMRQLLGFSNGLTAFGMIAASLVLGMSGFAYLNTGRKIDFYHSLPVRREVLYAANWFCGILMLAVPYAIGLVLSVGIAAANGAPAAVMASAAWEGFWLHMLYFILLYAAVIIAAMLTGHLVVEFFAAVVIAGYVPFAAAIVSSYFSAFFTTYYETNESLFRTLAMHGSPVAEYVVRVSQASSGEMPGAASLAALAVSVFLFLLGLVLYRLRPSEAAGRAMAFRVTKPAVRCLLSILSGLALGLMFWTMQSSTGWALFGVFCGAIITHCVIEIIYHFDFKKLFSHPLQMAVCAAAGMALLCVFRFDLMEYDSYLPDAESVRSAGITVNCLDSWVSHGGMSETINGTPYWNDGYDEEKELPAMSVQDTEIVRELAEEGIRQAQLERAALSGSNAVNPYTSVPADGARNAAEAETEETEEELPTIAVVCYTLKNGGKAWRRYSLDVNRVMDPLNRLWADEGYQEGTFSLARRAAENVGAVRVRELDEETKLDALTAEKRAELLAVYQEEFGALTMETMKSEYPVGIIQFATPEMEEAYGWWSQNPEVKKNGGIYEPGYGYLTFYELQIRDYYPIYPSFRKTIALLSSYGAELGDGVNRLVVTMVSVTYCADEEEGVYRSLRLPDAEAWKEILPVLKDTDYSYYDPLYLFDGNYTVDLEYAANDGTASRSMRFADGEVPEAVTAAVQEAERKEAQPGL